MNTFQKRERTEENQKTAIFTGEGAYHGSTKNNNKPMRSPIQVDEMSPTTLDKYRKSFDEVEPIRSFEAYFPHRYEVKKVLQVPSQQEIREDGITFVWCPLDRAKEEAGPLTKKVILEMENHLERKKKYVYIDSKIQYFQRGDLAVDSKLWHVDGTITFRGPIAKNYGYELMHDMRARFDCKVSPPKYLAYQSSFHCATEFINQGLFLRIPELSPNFEHWDYLVRYINPMTVAQPTASIVSFDGLSLHRAVPAISNGWRLWIRCMETDREVKLNSSIIDCYGTVFKQN